MNASRQELARRLQGEVARVLSAIENHDPGCWEGYLGLFQWRLGGGAATAEPAELSAIAECLDPLIRAAATADALECLRVLHESGCLLEATPPYLLEVSDFEECQLIHLAAKSGAHRVVGWLIDQQICDADVRSTSHRTALHVAAELGRVPVVSILLERHAFIDAATSHGETPLHLAIKANAPGVVGQLIEAGANLGATAMAEITPLSLAATLQRVDCARLLLDRGAPVTRALPELLRILGPDILNHPMLAGVRLERCRRDEVARLFEQFNPPAARMLLERGADPASAAEYALRNPTHALLPLIRQYGRFRYTDAHWHIAARSRSGMRQLIEDGADPNTSVTGRDGLRMPVVFYLATVTEALPELIPFLLARGADATPPAHTRLGPLLCELTARGRCTPELVRALTERGEQISAQNSFGCTALHEHLTACWSARSLGVLAALLDAGADVNEKNNAGHTPLMLAVHIAYGEALERSATLLRAGARVDLQDIRGWTVLHHLFAIQDPGDDSDRPLLLARLLEAGASVLTRDLSGAYPDESGDVHHHRELRHAVRRIRTRALLYQDECAPRLISPVLRPK